MCSKPSRLPTSGQASDSGVSDALLALDLVRGVSRRHLRELLVTFGTPEEVFAADLHTLRALTGCSASTACACRAAFKEAWDRIPAERQAMGQLGCRLLAEHMTDYPPLLKFIPDPPLLLRLQGLRYRSERNSRVLQRRNATRGHPRRIRIHGLVISCFLPSTLRLGALLLLADT